MKKIARSLREPRELIVNYSTLESGFRCLVRLELAL
jgi:hypothetical protein